MNDIQKKTYIDKDETDSMEKNKQMKKTNKQIVCTYNNETSKDYKQYTIEEGREGRREGGRESER